MKAASRRAARWFGRLGGAAAAVVVVLFVLFWANVGTNVAIRTDTGELRYTFLGITYARCTQRVRLRTRLLAAARIEPPVQWRWVSCGSPDREKGFNKYAEFYHDQYALASVWSDIDPRITRYIIQDLNRHLSKHGCTPPIALSDTPVFAMTWPGVVQYHRGDGYSISPKWASDQGVRLYLEAKGYGLPDGTVK